LIEETDPITEGPDFCYFVWHDFFLLSA
jgi:hypothetical protein